MFTLFSIKRISLLGTLPFLMTGLLLVLTLSASRAQLTLTPATAAADWQLTTFASGFPTNGSPSGDIGPFGIAFTDSGGVIVSDSSGNVRVFPSDQDGQQCYNTPPAQNYGEWNAVALARVGSAFYMTQQGNVAGNGALVQINPDGTFNQTIIPGLTHATGLAVNPNNGHLFVSQYDSDVVWDVDPVTQTATQFLTLPYTDGDGLTTDGTTLYAESGWHILGYHLASKSLVFDSGVINGADGCALGQGSLQGLLFVNTNLGEVFQIDLSTQVITLIASGGSRGDFVTVDPNGTLLLTQSDRIMRLIPPSGGSFETASIAVKPSTVTGSLPTTGTVTLSATAATDEVISLASTNAAANVPSTVTVPAGSLSVGFKIPTSAVSSTTTGNITATLNGITKSAKLTVTPIGVKAVKLSSSSVVGGNSVTGTVTLAAKAAPSSITVSFTSSNPSVVPTPASITIPAGSLTGQFTVNTNKVASNTSVTIKATANGIAKSTTLTVTP
ncbi:MAG TPA: hypothetical protein VFA07_05000 [Chthonomonadaceae bacterium]|nr:hypothetical protein [Chthonomonadaceae bacterium]